MRILGIDPGYSGGLALINEDKMWLTAAMPVRKIKATKREIDEPELVQLIKDMKPDHVFLEKVGAMPRQGVASMFNFGTGWGIVRGILTALDIEYTLVRPQQWQKVMFKDVERPKNKRDWDTKAAARGQCKLLWPNYDFRKSDRSRKPHEGICDAALIAEYARRTRVDADGELLDC